MALIRLPPGANLGVPAPQTRLPGFRVGFSRLAEFTGFAREGFFFGHDGVSPQVISSVTTRDVTMQPMVSLYSTCALCETLHIARSTPPLDPPYRGPGTRPPSSMKITGGHMGRCLIPRQLLKKLDQNVLVIKQACRGPGVQHVSAGPFTPPRQLTNRATDRSPRHRGPGTRRPWQEREDAVLAACSQRPHIHTPPNKNPRAEHFSTGA